MKIKNKFRYLLLLAISIPLNNLKAVNYPPKFESGTIKVITKNESYPQYFDKTRIKVVAANDKCGSFKITAKNDEPVYILPLIVLKGKDANTLYYNNNRITKPPLQKDETIEVFYDWAGNDPLNHYEVACLIADKEKAKRKTTHGLMPYFINVDCSTYVTIFSNQHNIPCDSQKAIEQKDYIFLKEAIGSNLYAKWLAIGIPTGIILMMIPAAIQGATGKSK